MTNKQDYLLEGLQTDVIDMLVKEDNMQLPDAIVVFHNSETFAKLSDFETGLYRESSRYIYNMLKRELSHGRLVP